MYGDSSTALFIIADIMLLLSGFKSFSGDDSRDAFVSTFSKRAPAFIPKRSVMS
jgi:hypothetical protein